MLVPYVITYELDPPSWLGARKYHTDASTTRETRPLTSVPTVKVMPADGRTPSAETVFRLRASDHIEAVCRRGRNLRRSRGTADAAGRVGAGVPGATRHELHADGARCRRSDRECDRIDVARIRRVLVVADAADRVTADHVGSLTERSVWDRVRRGEGVPGHGDAHSDRRDQGANQLPITEKQRRSMRSPPAQLP